MKRMKLATSGDARTTALSVGLGALEEAGRAAADSPTVLLVTDENVADTPWPARVEAACLAGGGPEPLRFLLPAGEQYKGLEVAAALSQQWLEAGAGRDAVVLALGGGVVTDLAGFAASIFLRGLPWIAVPTTVLGMADASVGGKTGVNLAAAKNILGSFWHPISVHSDPDTLKTLDDSVYREGWAEVIKAAAIADRELFERLESKPEAIGERDASLLSELLAASIAVKAAVVEADAREAGPREILNFGHTLAHAIETASDHEISHGEAVAIGMVAEARLGVTLGRVPDKLSARIASCCSALGLPDAMPASVDDRAMAAALGHDKKRREGKLRVALPTALGAHDPQAPCVETDAAALLAAARS